MVGWFSWFGGSIVKPEAVPEATLQRLERKCRPVKLAHNRCKKANLETETACRNLETSLISCYADELCKPEAEEHRKCYMSVVNTGRYKGEMHCRPYIVAMNNSLKDKGVTLDVSPR